MEKNIFELLAGYPAEKPDEIDLEMLENIDQDPESDTMLFSEYKESVIRRRETEYSGKVNLRIPKSLHGDLSHEAKRQGVSLNQYISYVLASRPR